MINVNDIEFDKLYLIEVKELHGKRIVKFTKVENSEKVKIIYIYTEEKGFVNDSNFTTTLSRIDTVYNIIKKITL